jgi:predicted aldo/keto reductase-like oxidoreductase
VKKKDIVRRDFMRGAVASGVGLGLLRGSNSQAAPFQQEVQLSGKVPRTELGTTGKDIPILLMGCVQKFDPRYDKRLHRAVRLGVNYVDTAQGYSQGQSHKTLQPFLKQVGRENVWVTSKVNLGKSPSVEGYKANLESSLRDLDTDYLDMFFMHAVQLESQLDPEYLKMAEELKKSGQIGFFGFSCHHDNVPELLMKAARVSGIDAIMFRYNFRKYGDLKLNKAMDAAKKAGIGLIAMKTQGSVPADKEEVLDFQSKDFTLEQAKLKAVWEDERIDAAVSTMSNMQQLQDNVAAAMSPVKLSMSDFIQLNRLAAVTADYYCQGCNNICESRVEPNLRIADVLRYLMYYDSYGDTEEARRLYAELTPEERDPNGVDFRAAMRACPQGINITQRLSDAERFLKV